VPINPNGMCMDLLRSCYSTSMRFFRDDPTECDVIWYWCPPDAKPFPGPTVFNSANWDSQKGIDGDLGEVRGAPRPWRSGQQPWVDGGFFFNAQTFSLAAAQVGDLVTVATNANPHMFQPGSEVFFGQLNPGLAHDQGPLTVYGLPGPSTFTVSWPFPINQYWIGQTLSQPVVWGRYRGQTFIGDQADYEDGCQFPSTPPAITNETGQAFDGMNVPRSLWLSIITITRSFPTNNHAGQVLELPFIGPLTPEISILYQDTSVDGPCFGEAFYFGGVADFDAQGFYPQPTGVPGLIPDFWSADQSTFWWTAWAAWFPLWVPIFPPPFHRQEVWCCIITTYDPRERIPGPPVPMFPFGFFPDGYWPPYWDFSRAPG
jgi:hypothetical protein